MSPSEYHRYTRDEFLGEFFPDTEDKAAITAGMEQLRAEHGGSEQEDDRQKPANRHSHLDKGDYLGNGQPDQEKHEHLDAPAYGFSVTGRSTGIARLVVHGGERDVVERCCAVGGRCQDHEPKPPRTARKGVEPAD